ncbi:hypothetical protein HBI80_190810 [Parastagonospora nodorum]|nr:hypothetical protein HBI80_190810 [Parastagonospora nodorum]
MRSASLAMKSAFLLAKNNCICNINLQKASYRLSLVCSSYGMHVECCGPNSNMMLCPGGTCQDSGGDSSAYSCPPVMLSSEAPAPILTPVPTVTEVSAFLTSAAPSFVSPSLAPAPQSTTARTCPGGLLCGNDTFCSIDNKNCCPQFEGQTYCPGAGICFRPSVGDQCCSDKICYSPQICAPGGYV